MYLLNLVFDPGQTNGLFLEYKASGEVLTRSQVWLQLDGPEPPDPNQFDPLKAQWIDRGPDTTFRFQLSQKPGTIAVRIAPSAPITGAPLQLVVLFGRKQHEQDFASPFTLDNSVRGRSAAVFNFSSEKFPLLCDGSFYRPLRPLSIEPPPGQVHRYEFIVGATINNGEVTFGHDPEMDVEL